MLVKVLNSILLLTVSLTPLLPASFGFGYELIKVLAFIVLTIISGLIFVFLLSTKKIKIQPSKIKTAALIFLLILSFTSAIGINPGESFTGNSPYYQGVIVYWLLFLFFLMISSVKIDNDLTVKFLSFSALAVSFIAIFQFIQLNIFKIETLNYAGRVISTFGQPNLYSGFLLLSLPFALNLKQNEFFLALISLGIISSLSRSSIILAFAFFALLLFKNFKDKGLIIFLFIFLIINAVTFSLDKTTGVVWEEVVMPLKRQGIYEDSAEKRIHIIPVLLTISLQRPLTGYGIDSIDNLYKSYFSNFKPELKNYSPLYFNMMNLNIDRSHNYFLDILIFSGIFGLGAYLYLLYLLFKTKKPFFITLFLILYVIWFQFQVQSVVHLMLFWLVAGVIDNSKYLIHDKS